MTCAANSPSRLPNEVGWSPSGSETVTRVPAPDVLISPMFAAMRFDQQHGPGDEPPADAPAISMRDWIP